MIEQGRIEELNTDTIDPKRIEKHERERRPFTDGANDMQPRRRYRTPQLAERTIAEETRSTDGGAS